MLVAGESEKKGCLNPEKNGQSAVVGEVRVSQLILGWRTKHRRILLRDWPSLGLKAGRVCRAQSLALQYQDVKPLSWASAFQAVLGPWHPIHAAVRLGATAKQRAAKAAPGGFYSTDRTFATMSVGGRSVQTCRATFLLSLITYCSFRAL